MQAFFVTAPKAPGSCELLFSLVHRVTLNTLGKLNLQGMEELDKGNGFPLTEWECRWNIGKELFPVNPGHKGNYSL